MLLSVIIRVCMFIVFISCINNLNVYGTLTILKSLPNLLILLIFNSPFKFCVYVNGPSAIGLKNKFLFSL